MKLIYAPRALRDIEEILAYIHARSPRAAHGVSLAIEHAIDLCAENPAAAARTDEPNLFRRPLSQYAYAIFYRVDYAGDHLEIVRVIRGSRVKNLASLPDDD